MKKSNVFLDTMSSYLTKYTVITKGLSENTVRSYTYTFQLLFVFLKEEKNILPEKVEFELFYRTILEQFLLWLENSRECSISTRNQRLSGLSSFAKYTVDKEPVVAASFYKAVLGIPKKKAGETLPIYFTKEELSIMLHRPVGNGKVAYRDRVLLSVLYATGARAQELCDICVRDIHFRDKTSIKLVGKGRKGRIITIPAAYSVLLY